MWIWLRSRPLNPQGAWNMRERRSSELASRPMVREASGDVDLAKEQAAKHLVGLPLGSILRERRSSDPPGASMSRSSAWA